MGQWYYLAPENQTAGPVDGASIRSMIDNQLLSLENYVWDGTPVDQGGKWTRIAETELAITDLLLNVVLYTIAKSDKNHFSNGKLHKYLILLDKQYPIGITVGLNPQFKNDYVEQLSLALAMLKDKNLISNAIKNKRTKATIYDALAPAPNLPDQLERCLDKLLLEYDQTPGTRMP